jgi:hypothetical protein
MLGILLLLLFVVLLVGALPAWPYSRSWGYYPSGGLGLIRDHSGSGADASYLKGLVLRLSVADGIPLPSGRCVEQTNIGSIPSGLTSKPGDNGKAPAHEHE